VCGKGGWARRDEKDGVVQLFNRRSLALAVVLGLGACQPSQPVVQVDQSAQGSATAGIPDQVKAPAYVGRIDGRIDGMQGLTFMLVPIEGNKVLLYSGLTGSMPLSEVTPRTLDRIGIFTLKKPISEGFFFGNPNQVYRLRWGSDPRNPGSVLQGTFQAIDSYEDSTFLLNLLPYKGPIGAAR
jgi:hypothetical protein